LKNFEYITNYKKDDKAVKMSLRRPIDANPERGINGDTFAREMEFLASAGVEEVIIDINSKGGNIKEGFSIFQSIKDYPGKTTTRVIGIAASMAGMISQAGDERVIMDYGLFHTHGPQVPSGAKADKKLIEIMKGSLKTILKSKAGITDEESEKLLNGENLFTAVEALNLGFFDRIESSAKAVKLDANNTIDELYILANNFLNNHKSNTMKEVITFLGLENEANEEQVLNSVKELKNEALKIEELTNSLKEQTEALEIAKKEAEELENKVKDLKNLAAYDLINEKVKSGLIKAESVEAWQKLAVNNLDETKELLNSLSVTVKAEEIEEEIKPEETENRKEWDFQQWSQDAPKELEKMKNEQPEKFEELLNNYIND
jgi:ATP-dependent protease ClpP protease subunit